MNAPQMNAPLLPPLSGAASPSSGDLLKRTARGAGWVIGWRLTGRLMGLFNTLFLVRLLLPADFGLVALGSGFAVAIEALSTIGVEEALIRETAPTRALYDTGFTLNVLRGFATAAIIAATASLLAQFFAEPRLFGIMLGLALSAVIMAFENIGVVDFRRDIAFDKEFVLIVVPRMVSIVVTVVSALAFRSYWALMAGILAGRSFRIGLGYVMHPYRPCFTLRAWRQIAGFSFWTWARSLPVLVRERSNNFVIGRLLHATGVGIYAVGEEIADLPTSELVQPLCRACFAGFAAARRAGVGVADAYLRIIASMAIFTLPAGIGISLVADPVVRLAFGSHWLAAIPLVQILGISGALTIFGSVSATLFSAHAYLKSLFHIAIGTLVLRIALLLLLVPHHGLIGAALAVAISNACEQAVYIVLTFRRFAVRGRDLLRHLWRSVLATTLMAAVLYASGLGWSATAEDGRGEIALRLVVAMLLGAGVYVATLLAAWFAAGRPTGGESDVLALLRSEAPRIRAILRRLLPSRGAPPVG